MPNINLISERRDEKRRMETLTRQLFFGFSISVAALVSVGSFLLTERIGLSATIAEADAKMQKLQPALAEIDQVRKETSEKLPKVETLERARYDTLRWTMLFQSVSQALPHDVWLTTLGAPEGEQIVVTLAGSAPSQNVAAQVVQNLLKQPLFEKVEIPSTTRNDLDKRFGFQIVAYVKAIAIPQPAPPAQKKTAQAGQSEGDRSRA